MTLLFRMFGTDNVQFALMAIAIAGTAFRRGEALLLGNTIAFGAPMTYNRIVGAIGPFEAFEYAGIAVPYVALPFTAPFRSARQDNRFGAQP